MAVKNGSVLAKVSAKAASLEAVSLSSTTQADDLESQIDGLRKNAALTHSQALVVAKAFKDMSDAGVSF